MIGAQQDMLSWSNFCIILYWNFQEMRSVLAFHLYLKRKLYHMNVKDWSFIMYNFVFVIHRPIVFARERTNRSRHTWRVRRRFRSNQSRRFPFHRLHHLALGKVSMCSTRIISNIRWPQRWWSIITVITTIICRHPWYLIRKILMWPLHKDHQSIHC